jgi:hypothetical protein
MNPTDFEEELAAREQQYRSQPTVYRAEDVAAWKESQVKAYVMTKHGQAFEWMSPYRSPEIVTVGSGKVTVQRGEQVQEVPVPSGARVQQMRESEKGLEIQYASKEAEASRQFYEKLGYPEYGGKYQPFKIPEGYTVKEVKEDQQGLQVTFQPIPEEPSLSERLLGLLPKGISGNLGDIIMGKLVGVKVAPESPLAAPAGVVASGESLVYSIGRLAGFKTPRIPATLSGSLVSSVILSGGATLSGKPELIASSELQELGGKGGSYAAGTVLGDYLIGSIIGKGVEKAVSPIIGRVKGSAAEWLTESYEESVRAGGVAVDIGGGETAQVLWKPSLAEKIVMKITGAKPKELSSAIIGLPTLAEKEALGMSNLSKFITGMEAFDWTEAPRTVGLGYTEPIIETAGEATKEGIMAGVKQVAKEGLPYTVYHAGRQISLAEPQGLLGFEKARYTMGFTGKLGFVKERLPTLSDLLKETKAETTLSKLVFEPSERMLPVIPELSDVITRGLPRMAPEIFGAGSILLPHLLGREIQKPKREAKVKPLKRLAVGSVAKTVLSQRQAPLQIPKQATAQKLIPKQALAIPFPSPQVPMTTLPIPRLPHLPEGSSLASAILGRKESWFYKKHPVATGSEVAAHIFSGLPKQPKQHRGKKRR